jgi:hypothetical protein
MEGWMYPVSILLLVLLAFSFFRSGNTILAGLALVIGAYIIYSHETGYTATDFKNEMVENMDKKADDYKNKLNSEKELN